MLLEDRSAFRLLARSAGFEAIASDGTVGVVETPLFPPDAPEPDFLVLRVGAWPRARRPVVSAALVEEVDDERRTVRLRGLRADIERLPEHLPVAT